MRKVLRFLGASVVAVAAAGSIPSVTNAEPAGTLACAPQNLRYCAAVVGELLDTTLAELHPTQPSLGYDEVYYRLGRYTMGKETPSKLFDDWCAANGQKGVQSAAVGATASDRNSFTCITPLGSETPATITPMKTAVVGPGGQLYLTDGHHTLTSFWEVPGGGPGTHIRLRITGNLSAVNANEFWTTMAANGWTWLKDVDGNPIAPDRLPENLGLSRFDNDIYRGVLYFLRDIGFEQDDNSPAFQEFYWGQWLRAQPDPGVQPANFNLTDLPSYLDLVRNIGSAIVTLPDNAQIAGGLDAERLGRLDEFGQEAFATLSEPYSAAKPGKLAYSLRYKNSR